MQIIELQKTISEFYSVKENLDKKMSDLDNRIIHLYHVLEFEKMDAVAMVRFSKVLKKTLTERRDVKNKLRYFHSLDQILPTEKTICSRISQVKEKEQNSMKRYKNETKEKLKSDCENEIFWK